MTYVALFGWSFLAATVLPLGSEPAVILMIRNGHMWSVVVLVATLGNFAGACTTYFLGRGAAHALSGKDPAPAARRATALMNRYGAPALLLSWVPLLGDAIVAAAGMARVGVTAFAGWTFLGKAARYLVVAWGAHAF